MIKTLIFALFLTGGFTFSAWAKNTVSVTTFQNKSAPQSCDFQWSWWNDHLGDAFKDMLLSELDQLQKFELLEREHMSDIYHREQDLLNSEADHSLKNGQLKKAKLTLIGTVSEYEYCAEENKNKINIGSFVGADLGFIPGANVVPDIQLARAKAKIKILLRVVDTNTGRILQVIKSEGLVERSHINIKSDFLEIEEAKKSPIGEAAQMAIHKAVHQIRQ